MPRITRPITRETPDRDPVDLEPLMVRLEPGSKCLAIWRKGRRRKFLVRYADVFRLALRMAAAEFRRSKKK